MSDFLKAMSQKLIVTLGVSVGRSLQVPVDWVVKLVDVCREVRPHAACCVFKCLVGGWTTSHRMHEQMLLPCILGCTDCRDEINHYFLCSPLWQIASEALQVEAPLDLATRLCLVSPTPCTVRLLALTFVLYHYAKTRAKELGGATVVGSCVVQRIAFEAACTFVSHV